MNKIELAEKVATALSGQCGFGKCRVWSGHSVRVYVKNFGYVAIEDQGISLNRLKYHKQQIADLIEELMEIVPFPDGFLGITPDELRNQLIARCGSSKALDAERRLAHLAWNL